MFTTSSSTCSWRPSLLAPRSRAGCSRKRGVARSAPARRASAAACLAKAAPEIAASGTTRRTAPLRAPQRRPRLQPGARGGRVARASPTMTSPRSVDRVKRRGPCPGAGRAPRETRPVRGREPRSPRPRIARQWHPTKNGALRPRKPGGGLARKVWWKCPEGPDHEWRARVRVATVDGRGCPFCAGKRVSRNELAREQAPGVAAEWHPTKNGALAARGRPPRDARTRVVEMRRRATLGTLGCWVASARAGLPVLLWQVPDRRADARQALPGSRP